ncbi:MAG: NfeD family protein [Rhodospirillaceae bacterium]|nr:NfeD family protein [Rhodospirillales bacterium]
MEDITFWHWLILGIALIAAEVLVPGTFLLWPGIAAILTGALAYAAPALDWRVDALVFAALTVASALLGRKLYARLKHPNADEPALNRRADSLIGGEHILTAPLVGGEARMKVGDSTWKVVGEDLPAGTRVRVVGVEGISLRVERLDG